LRMRRKPNLKKRLDKCAHLLVKEPELHRGKWLSETPYEELHIELGCGKGRFTVETAKQHPHALLVGLEKVENVVVIALERADKQEQRNILFAANLADDLDKFFEPGEVSRIYLNFSDPWPSRRHAKRRLTSQSFLEMYKSVLRTGGEIHMKTDNLPLFEYSLEEFYKAGFEFLFLMRNLHENGPVGVMTDYEIKFHDLGVKINKCVVKNVIERV